MVSSFRDFTGAFLRHAKHIVRKCTVFSVRAVGVIILAPPFPSGRGRSLEGIEPSLLDTRLALWYRGWDQHSRTRGLDSDFPCDLCSHAFHN